MTKPSNPFQDTFSIADNLEDPFADSDEQRDPALYQHINIGPSIPITIEAIEANAKAIHTSQQEDELTRRERELEDREREFAHRQEEFRRMGGFRQPNFPPFYPIMYHDIDVEIKQPDRQLVTWLFVTWLFTIGALVWNMVSTLLLLTSHIQGNTTAGSDFGVALGYMFFITVASFFLWYRPVYNAFMKEKSLYYFVFFVFNGFHVLFQFYMAVGVPGSGSAGIINMISAFTDNKVVAGVFCSAAVLLWVAGGAFSLFLFYRVYDHWRSQGHTFEAAKGEALRAAATANV